MAPPEPQHIARSAQAIEAERWNPFGYADFALAAFARGQRPAQHGADQPTKY